jgi:hypothetical protein
MRHKPRNRRFLDLFVPLEDWMIGQDAVAS